VTGKSVVAVSVGCVLGLAAPSPKKAEEVEASLGENSGRWADFPEIRFPDAQQHDASICC